MSGPNFCEACGIYHSRDYRDCEAFRRATLALSDERDQWMRRLLDAERAAFLAGAQAGYKAGYEEGARIRQAELPQFFAPLDGPSLAELEALRWGTGGREHFGDQRPGDRPPSTREAAA